MAALTEDTAIVYTAVTSDGAGAPILPNEALETIAKSANRPILVDVEIGSDMEQSEGSWSGPA